jgi:hypothetical protein
VRHTFTVGVNWITFIRSLWNRTILDVKNALVKCVTCHRLTNNSLVMFKGECLLQGVT